MERPEQKLLNNHLAFLSTHRGALRRSGDTIFMESDRPEFTYALLGEGSNASELPRSTKSVQHFPWSRTSPEDLQRLGFTAATGLSYMILGENLPEWRVRNDVLVERVTDQAQMDIFSHVQSRGFNETPDSFERWHPWLKSANDRNLQNANQFFYIGCQSGDPMGVVLSVFDGETVGIYAVATLPQHRKKGVSAAVMQHAIHEAKARGARTITLQVKQDSYVEDFYRHLGFQRIFTTGVYHRHF